MTPQEFFTDHTYRMVFFGTSSIGLIAGTLGAFVYLRKQSLISDVIAHSALPGALGAFMIAVTIFNTDGRHMAVLLIGAVLAGTLSVGAANYIAAVSPIRLDTAMALTLTTFFGTGMLLMRTIGNGNYPGKGGVQDYLFGNASVITTADIITSVSIGLVAILIVVCCWKQFTARTFNAEHAQLLGIAGTGVDILLFTIVVVATVIGVKAVGLVLMVAFVVTPPAAARQWTRTLPTMVAASGAIGALGSGAGAYLSIAGGGLPTGPVVVLVLFACFALSMMIAPQVRR